MGDKEFSLEIVFFVRDPELGGGGDLLGAFGDQVLDDLAGGFQVGSFELGEEGEVGDHKRQFIILGRAIGFK